MKTPLKNIDPKILKRIQALRLMDDDFMTVVFDGDKKLTQFLLRILLERDDLFVKSVMTQREKRNLYGRSVKLDILAVDSCGKNYDIEVQRADEGALPRRVRYNQAMLDSHTLKRKQKFNDLPELYIIFITENDYYGLGLPYYAIEKRIRNTDLPFDDGCNIIYVNGAYRGDDPLGKLMHDFCTPDADKMNYSEIADRVRYHKQQDGGKETMCKIIEEYGDEREEEGKQKTAIENAKNALTMGLSPEQAAQITSLPLEQVLSLKEEIEREFLVH